MGQIPQKHPQSYAAVTELYWTRYEESLITVMISGHLETSPSQSFLKPPFNLSPSNVDETNSSL